MVDNLASLASSLDLISIVACTGIALSAFEELTMRAIYAEGGLLSWSVLRVTRRRAIWQHLENVIDRLFEASAFVGFLFVRLATALCLIAFIFVEPRAHVIVTALTAAVLAQLWLMKHRTSYGLDGADHMYIVVFLGLTVARVMPQGSVASVAGVLYIASQSLLSYLVAGIAKLAGASWRDGSAINGIMTTKIYGSQIAAAILRERPVLGRLVCWSVIAFEITFVAILFVEPGFMWIMLALGMIFHASTAVLMGLNSFFLAFVATYPAIVYANVLVHRFVI